MPSRRHLSIYFGVILHLKRSNYEKLEVPVIIISEKIVNLEMFLTSICVCILAQNIALLYTGKDATCVTLLTHVKHTLKA